MNIFKDFYTYWQIAFKNPGVLELLGYFLDIFVSIYFPSKMDL